MPYAAELTVALGAARAAGEVVRDLYEGRSAAAYTKGDGSPVTDADLAADRVIRAHLGAAFPDDAILTEEGADDPARLPAERVWVVDPIDGTAQFIARTGQFDTLVALVVGGRPVVGVVVQPSTGLWLAAAEGEGATVGLGGRSGPFALGPATGASAGERGPTIMTSVWFGAPDTLPLLDRVAGRLGSPPVLATETGVVARSLRQRLPEGGLAAVGVDATAAGRVQPDEPVDVVCGVPIKGDGTMAWEWDFAATDVVVREAGGAFSDCWGRPHRYNKPRPRNHGGFVMSADPATHERFLRALEPELGELVQVEGDAR